MNVYYIYTVESHQQIIGMQNILLEVTCVNCTINLGNLIMIFMIILNQYSRNAIDNLCMYDFVCSVY